MNQQPPNPSDAFGDAAIEARIVAWVLGEASNFEAAELERLCHQQPALLAFHQRMTTLHGLLTEAEPAEPDTSWKLPPEKRQILDEVLGKPNAIAHQTQKQGRRNHSRNALAALAACLVLTLTVIKLLGPADHVNPVHSIKSHPPATPGRYAMEAKPKSQIPGSIQSKEQTQLARQSAQRQMVAAPAVAAADGNFPDVGISSSITPMGPLADGQLSEHSTDAGLGISRTWAAPYTSSAARLSKNAPAIVDLAAPSPAKRSPSSGKGARFEAGHSLTTRQPQVLSVEQPTLNPQHPDPSAIAPLAPEIRNPSPHPAEPVSRTSSNKLANPSPETNPSQNPHSGF